MINYLFSLVQVNGSQSGINYFSYWLPHPKQRLEHSSAVCGGVRQVGRFALSSKFLTKGVQEASKVILLALGLLRLAGVGGFEATSNILSGVVE